MVANFDTCHHSRRRDVSPIETPTCLPSVNSELTESESYETFHLEGRGDLRPCPLCQL
jgi:hypothetical protein